MIDSSSSNHRNSTSELLNTNSLTLSQIRERLDLIKNLLEQEKIEFSEEEEKKLEKLIDKSGYLNDQSIADLSALTSEIQRLVQLAESVCDLLIPKSEKYLTSPELLKLSKSIAKNTLDLELIGSFDPSAIREPRSSLRLSSNCENLKSIVYKKTRISKIGDDEFKISYPEIDDKESKNQTCLEFSLKFINDKVNIIFEKTFKESDPDLMKPEDHLYPEEIQIAMLQKLIDSHPQIFIKIKSAKKINCIRSTITNSQSLLRISKYLELKAENPENLETKKILSSSPNQSNTENFINQLKHVFGIEISQASLPKVAKFTNLKQTFSVKKSQALQG